MLEWLGAAGRASLHAVKEDVGRAAGSIGLRLSAHVGIVALVPPLVAEVVHLTDVVPAVE